MPVPCSRRGDGAAQDGMKRWVERSRKKHGGRAWVEAGHWPACLPEEAAVAPVSGGACVAAPAAGFAFPWRFRGGPRCLRARRAAGVALRRSGAAPDCTVSIRSHAAGSPGATLRTLTNPTLTSGARQAQYTASGDGIALDAGTTSWVLIDAGT